MEKKKLKRVLICIAALLAMLIMLFFVFNLQITIWFVGGESAILLDRHTDYWGNYKTERVLLCAGRNHPYLSAYILLRKNNFGIWQIEKRGNYTPDKVVNDEISFVKSSDNTIVFGAVLEQEERLYCMGKHKPGQQLDESIFPKGTAVTFDTEIIINEYFEGRMVQFLPWNASFTSLSDFVEQHQDEFFKEPPSIYNK